MILFQVIDQDTNQVFYASTIEEEAIDQMIKFQEMKVFENQYVFSIESTELSNVLDPKTILQDVTSN